MTFLERDLALEARGHLGLGAVGPGVELGDPAGQRPGPEQSDQPPRSRRGPEPRRGSRQPPVDPTHGARRRVRRSDLSIRGKLSVGQLPRGAREGPPHGRAHRLRRVLVLPGQRVRVRHRLRRPARRCAASSSRSRPGAAERPRLGRRDRPSWCCCTAAPRTPTPGTRSPSPSTARWWPSTCPGTATPTAASPGSLNVQANADDIATVHRGPRPDPDPGRRHVARRDDRPRPHRPAPRPGAQRLVLVDVTPGVDGEKAQTIVAFIDGPETFPSFEDLLARTIEFNPTRTESSLRRGILHNAVQQDDGTLGVALPPLPRGRRGRHPPRLHRSVGGREPGGGAAHARARHATAVRRRRRRRGRAAPPAARRRGSSTSKRPATACRATRRSSWPTCSTTSSPELTRRRPPRADSLDTTYEGAVDGREVDDHGTCRTRPVGWPSSPGPTPGWAWPSPMRWRGPAPTW